MAEPVGAPPKPEKASLASMNKVLDSPEFKSLVMRRWTINLVLLAALFLTYYGFILLVAYDKPLLAQRIGQFTTLGIPLGAGVIVVGWILTAIYVNWANTKYDPEVERLKGLLKK